jgi:hypothetical protein
VPPDGELGGVEGVLEGVVGGVLVGVEGGVLEGVVVEPALFDSTVT